MMKFKIHYFLILLLISCSHETNIFNGSRFYLTKDDLKYQVDSIKVIEVIDNRLKKDSIIGKSEKGPLILSNPLNDYLKMSFNALICKDSTQKDFVSVKLYVDEFTSSRKNTFFYECVDFKFSYLFEFPYKSDITQIRIKDSLTICNFPDLNFNHFLLFWPISRIQPFIRKQRQLIINSIRESSHLFLSNYSTLIKNEVLTKINTNLKLLENKENNKHGILINSYFHYKSVCLLISYLRMKQKQGSSLETGYGYAFQYLSLYNNQYVRELYLISFPLVYNYYPFEQNKNFYLGSSIQLNLAEEKHPIYSGIYCGGRLEESLGYNLFNFLSLSAGVYQQGYLGIKPFSDFGYFVSLNITGGY